MGDCGCNKAKVTSNQPAPVPPKVIRGAITKQACPKCNYFMTLIVHPATREKTLVCQNTLCNHSMPYVMGTTK